MITRNIYRVIFILLILHCKLELSLAQIYEVSISSLKQNYLYKDSCWLGTNKQLCQLNFYDQKKQLIVKGYIKNSMLDSTWLLYNNENGNLCAEMSYKEGKLNGAYKVYTKKGRLFQVLNFDDGIPHGKLVTYSLFAPYRILESFEINHGVLDGKVQKFHEGVLSMQMTFKNGKADGNLKLFNSQNELEGQVIYKNGLLVSNLVYYSNNVKNSELVLDNKKQVFIERKKYNKNNGRLRKTTPISTDVGFKNPIELFMNTGAPLYDLLEKMTKQ